MEKRPCESCGGSGFIIIGAGLSALQDAYPELPIREMAKRGWFGTIENEEDTERCESAFLHFWGVATHAEVRALIYNRTL